MTKQIEEKCKDIKLVITDVDGILTDGGMYYSENGDELKKFNVRDGVAVALMQLAGLKVGVFTGEKMKLNERRMKKIGMDFVCIGVQNKLNCLNEYLSQNNYDAKQVVYIGDEINDFSLIGEVGLFLTVEDANDLIKEKADLILKTHGGQGALREVAQIILSAQNKFDYALNKYLENNTMKNRAESD